MKKIALKQFTQQGGLYTIHLGNGTVHTFPSKRHLTAFINQTNKFLSTQLFEVHEIYMRVWQEYKRCWFYFGFGPDKGTWSLHALDQRKIDEAFSSCEQYLTLAHSRSDWNNGNHAAFKHIHTAINCLKEVTKILLPMHKSRSSTADVYRMNALFNELLHAESAMNGYGQLNASGHISYTTFDKLKYNIK